MSALPDRRDGAPVNRALESDARDDVDPDQDNSKPKKKRRIVKTLDKKYECQADGCSKSYSRAEHLYRHQLNHTPKQIYRCDYPGCDRNFVRADLCTRHRERHTSKNSHLGRKQIFQNQLNAAAAVPGSDSPTESATTNQSPMNSNHAVDTTASRPDSSYMNASGPPQQQQQQPQPQDYGSSAEQYPNSAMQPLSSMQTGAGVNVDAHLTSGSSSYNHYPGNMNGPGQIMAPPPADATRRYNYEGEYNRQAPMANGYAHHPQPLPVNSMHPPPMPSPHAAGNVYAPPNAYPSNPNGNQFRSPTNYTSIPAYAVQGSYGATSNPRPGSGMSPPHMGAQETPYPVPNSRANSVMDFSAIDTYNTGYTMPVFGGYGFNRSPPNMIGFDDDVFAQLLDPRELGDMNMAYPESPALQPEYSQLLPPTSNAMLLKAESDGSMNDRSEAWENNRNAAMRGIEINMPETAIDTKIQGRIIKLVRSFEETEPLPGRKSKEDVVSGDTEDPSHALSVTMLKTALWSYWNHIHAQMPIMHRPTFQPRTCPDLLLLAMICLGGSCLERTHTTKSAYDCSELAFFAAYHIRWQVFKDAEFRPTAKLWTFQTMLLLELFEKMYSTRPLHERAHIHHATTLTVMRRGSSLVGRAVESQTDSDPTRTPPGPDGSINTSGHNTPDAYWNRWITTEATRRVAFAAFVIDSTHATLFGHSAVMSPHDMRLALPCDEALWAATSSAEVQRVEASLAANGFKPPTFLEGLKKTLNGQKVRTNTFGRVILMAGLLNVSWHMNQRDLQISSLSAKDHLGLHKWQTPLMHAFDFWRKDFDDMLAKSDHWQHVCSTQGQNGCVYDHRDNVFESRTCLHSLAHMALHIDIVDCEVFAGSERVLGRQVTDQDRYVIQLRMRKEWAPSARARDAVFYALRFLCEVLIPDDALKHDAGKPPGVAMAQQGKRLNPNQPPMFTYSARDDYLLNRPWVLYFAAMIVWSYGFALDGPIKTRYNGVPPREMQVADMQSFLIRVGGVASPDDLEKLENRNQCLGLLLLLRECFAQPRWELLHEARDMLTLCIDQLLPGTSSNHSNEVKNA